MSRMTTRTSSTGAFRRGRSGSRALISVYKEKGASIAALAHRCDRIFCLERPRQPENVLGEVGQDQVGRDRRDQVQARLPELALDVVLGGEAEATVRLQADVGRLPRRLGAEVLGHVGFRTTGFLLIEQRGGLV